MDKFSLKQLRYFEALAHHGHFGRAADASAISQPALSMQIKDLETSVGAALFERTARHVRLTSFGEDFARHTREILQAVDELADLTRAVGGKLVGRLRIGVIPTVAPYVLPSIIRGLAKTHPGLDLQIRETLTSGLLRELAEGRLDAAIVALPISEPWVTEVPLFTENFVLVRPEQDRNKPVPTTDKLKEMRLLLLEEGHCFRDQALSFCNIRSALPRDGLDASSLTTLVQMVGAGIGITLIPEMAVRVETKSANVAISSLAAPQPSRNIGMIWRKTNPLGKQLGEVSEVVKNVVLSSDDVSKM